MANGLSIPTSQQSIIEGANVPMSQVWWRFLQALMNRTLATVPYTVSTGLIAAGASQSDAFKMTAEWNEFDTVAAGTGGVLPSLGIGFDVRVWNQGANPLNVYPFVGAKIDALATNGAFVLAAGKMQVFSQLTGTQFRSLQL